MSYLSSGGDEGVLQETLELLAELARMPLPPEDVATLATALTNQLNAAGRIDQLDLEDVQPALWFDPRWDE